MKEILAVPQELKKKILDVVDSAYMKNYLEQNDDYSVYEWVDLIASSPRPMELKLNLLKELMQIDMPEEDRIYIKECLQAGHMAMDRLNHFDSGKSILVMKTIDTEPLDFEIMNVDPFRSYQAVLGYIRREFEGACRDEEDDPHDYRDYYFELELYDFTESDEGESVYRYICNSYGEVQYYMKNWNGGCGNAKSKSDRMKENYDEVFRGTDGLLHWMTPYQIGDILYVDLRPYFRPTYCVIHYISPELPWDCCSVRCLYLADGRYVGEAALKHGRFLPYIDKGPYDSDRQFISPLYRAELAEGNLPEGYGFLKLISERLKNNPGLMEKIDGLYFGDKEMERLSTCVASRPVVVDRYNLKPGEKNRDIEAVTRQELLEAMDDGCV
ncbi:MAG: hypothetical protein LUC41_00650 [Clostridiales bacterium]|nr:hypothetical protein [Clostridiales bacterium]